MNNTKITFEHTCVKCQAVRVATDHIPFGGLVPIPYVAEGWLDMGPNGELCMKCANSFDDLWREFLDE